MTDPFFATAPSNWNTGANTQNTENDKKTNQESIQALLEQQRQIQEKYKELKNLQSTENLTVEQSQDLQDQVERLIGLYTQNKETLALLTTTIEWDKEIHVNKDVTVKKESNMKKLSFKWIAIWCTTLFILLIWLFALLFFRVIQNPNSFKWMINATTAIQLTQVFSIIFFGLLFLISLWILILNAYRIITIKNRNKIKEILWSILWFILLIATLVIGSTVFSKLRGITPDTFIKQNQLVSAYAILAEKWDNIKTIRIWSDNSLVLIAPINISYQINFPLLERQMISKYWDITITKLELNCGNWNNLIDVSSNLQWQCFYTTKWQKNVSLNISYIKNQTNEQASINTNIYSTNIISDISISTNQWWISSPYNDINVWKNPIKIKYDASNVFKDLNLQTYDINWDADADWVIDKTNYVAYTHVYSKAGVYHVNVRFPKVNDYIYTFPIRIEQSDVPVAEISYSMITTTQYNIMATFPWEDPDIASYSFSIINKSNNTPIDVKESKEPSITYTFPWDGVYAIQLNFVTQEGKQWNAESDDIVIGGSKYQVLYDIHTKTPTMPNFAEANDKNNIIIRELPTILRLNITSITPISPTTSITVLKDWSPVVWKNNIFDITIEDTKDYVLTINVSDLNHEEMTYTKTINISVKRDDIVPKLIITPDTVGTSPFTVNFDASTTSVNDPNDEIIYFSRDFWDWKSEINTSQSIIRHTYNYDYTNENWEYHPKVTLKTKNWREVFEEATILVKKQVDNVSINLESHPAQLAMVGDKVDMSISVNWTPSKILRDFWNWKTLECKNRDCTSTSRIYDKAGSYEIKVIVSYDNRTDIEWTITLVVR